MELEAVMFKEKTYELAGRKGVRLGPKGGSISKVIPVWIYRSMTELKLDLLPFSQFTWYGLKHEKPVGKKSN